MTNEEPKSSEPTSENKLFTEQANPLLTDLLYPSESDEPIETVTCYLKQAEPLTVSQIKDWQMLPPSVYVEETPETDFWKPVSTDQDWYGDEEKARTAKFQQLKKLAENELTVRQVFRVGESEMDVYLLGLQKNGERAGIKTKIVQT
ncbi:nuclease A inhibitor family protein [Spirosoma foliorum]|uniref:Nuclease A inhibitor family protein n=1 Tax=Spirosoma foliorum TaxID=2710596 RepID=A0A7G5H3S4_9BACT|nr:nuclease A inhibitor family protein [Spirosoma foliorum]QMW05766.1 nuclease A inhibitor family protein [Spirosoma foliorum]